MFQRPRHTHHNPHNRDNDRKDDGTHTMITQRVQYFRSGQDMKPNEQDIIRQQHESGKLVSDPGFAESVVAEVANIFDLGVLHDEFVHGEGGDVEQDAGNEHGDYAGDPAEDG